MLKQCVILSGTTVALLLAGIGAVADALPYVKPMERFEFSALGVVSTVGSNSVLICSGTLVAQDLVITSAHCLEEHKGLLQHVEFEAGRTGSRSLAVSGAIEVIQHPVWSFASGPSRHLYDIAVVRLARPIPEERVQPIALFPADREIPAEVALLGYRASEQKVLRGRFDCGLAPLTSNGLFSSDCSVSGGNSGGPVLVKSGEDWTLAGVIVASNRSDGSTLVVEVGEWLRGHVRDALKRDARRTAKVD